MPDEYYGEIASVKGNSTDGFMYISGHYSCNSGGSTPCAVLTEVRSKTTVTTVSTCSTTGFCAGNTGIALDTSSGAFDFYR